MSVEPDAVPVGTGVTSRRERLYEIDLLRFVAALSVVLYHWSYRGYMSGLTVMRVPEIDPVTRYGYLGVELFFVISGFVILMSARAGTLRDFAVSRVVRLYPAFWFCCTLTFAFAIFFSGGHPRYEFSWMEWVANLTMFGNYMSVKSIDNVYWSLFVEMRFYLMVAVILWFDWLHKVESILWLWLLVVAVQRLVRTGPLWHVLNAEYAPLFVAGAMLFLVYESGWSAPRIGAIVVSYLLAAWQAIQHAGSSDIQGGDPVIVCCVLGACYIAMILVASNRLMWLRRSWWLPLGAITYPLYLVHQNIGYMAFNVLSGSLPGDLLFCAAVVAVILAAYMIHYFVERPVARRMKRWMSASPPRIASGPKKQYL